MGAGFGDRLAKGASKAQFPPAGGSVSQSKWDSIFGEFDAEKYRGDAHSKASGDVGVESGKAGSNSE